MRNMENMKRELLARCLTPLGVKSRSVDQMPGGGGGGGTASLKVGTHCPTTVLVCFFILVGPSVFFDRPLFLKVTDHRPPKSHILNT